MLNFDKISVGEEWYIKFENVQNKATVEFSNSGMYKNFMRTKTPNGKEIVHYDLSRKSIEKLIAFFRNDNGYRIIEKADISYWG